MDALAGLANAKLGPFSGVSSATRIFHKPYEFSYFDANVLPPSGVVGVGSADSGSAGYDIGIHVVRVYSFKTISGRKHYSKKFATGWFKVTSALNNNITWSWNPPPGGADGYIVLSGHENLPGGYSERTANFTLPFHNWKEVTSPTFFTTWEIDYRAADGQFITLTNPDYNPINVAPWTREMGLIKNDIFTLMEAGSFDITSDWLLSGPWCVAVGNRLVTNFPAGGAGTTGARLDAVCHYRDVEFYYPAAAHAGNVTITRESFTKTQRSGSQLNTPSASYTTGSGFAGGTVTGKLVVECQTGVGAWTRSLVVVTGVITIVSEVWREIGQRIECDFVVMLPSGVSTLRADVSSTGGVNTYWCLWAGLEMASVVLTPSSVAGIHPASATAKVVYGNVVTSVIGFWGGVVRAALRAGSIDGVWVAKTLPVMGVHTFLDQDLPNYAAGFRSNFSSSGMGSSGPRSAVPFYLLDEQGNVIEPFVGEENFVEPAVANRPSLWPVFRDVDFLAWKVLNPGGAKKPVPFYSNGFHSSNRRENVVDNLVNWVQFVPENGDSIRVSASGNVPVRIYYSTTGAAIDPGNSGTYNGYVDTGTLRIPEDFPIATGQNVSFAFTAVSGTLTTVDWRYSLFASHLNYDPGILPVFFSVGGSPNQDNIDGRAANETFSYNYSAGTRESFSLFEHSHQIPVSGYCIYEIAVRRQSVGGNIPTTGTVELAVQVGRMENVTIDSAGTFVSMQTVTIPAGQASATVSVFWPVLGGTPLAYQCAEAVDIAASVNHQPGVITNYDEDSRLYTGFAPPFGYYSKPKGRFSGHPYFRKDRVLRFPNNTYYDWPRNASLNNFVTFPVCATVYNDLEALLNLL